MSCNSYRLLDFGNGRKLEQFGARVLDRGCPAAEGYQPSSTDLWKNADRLDPANEPHPTWSVEFPIGNNAALLKFQLKFTPFGHVGLFPEQYDQWQWLYNRCLALGEQSPGQPLRALNLFAYTGGSTLAMAAGGAEVVHIDSSAPAVNWARTNAELNSMRGLPIRWIVEDARKFIERELRRGNRYDIIVLDPPAYGHSPNGRAWNLSEEWLSLCEGCLALVQESTKATILWTGHSDVPTVDDLARKIRGTIQGITLNYGRSTLRDEHHRSLDAGFYMQATSTIEDKHQRPKP